MYWESGMDFAMNLIIIIEKYYFPKAKKWDPLQIFELMKTFELQ